ncbi:MAG TPA: hypothetical protein VG755_03940 [Nannocystaceae bacterium]|nr:hypothetical protein [Nannocystaceae bacterium]
MDQIRVALFQPESIGAARPELGLVGAQFWLASRVSEIADVEAMALMCFDEDGPRSKIAAWTPAGDGELGRTMAMVHARIGLTSSYARRGARPYCERACLLESRGDATAPWLATRELDVLGLPVAVGAHRMLCAIASACGLHDAVPEWTELFETDDAELAGDHLVALGCYAAAIQGATIEDPSPAFAAILCGIATRSRPAISLLPALVEALEVSRACSGVAITGLVRAAVDIYGAIPAEWSAICASHRVDQSVRTRWQYGSAAVYRA